MSKSVLEVGMAGVAGATEAPEATGGNDPAPYAPCAPCTPGDKRMRADALRNRALLLQSASAAFSERGSEASLEDIAKHAGVGIGTLYRHFPTRNDLIEAVYRQEVETLCSGVDELLATLAPDEALAEWMQRFIGYVAVKRGLVGALKQVLSADSEVFAYTHGLLYSSAGRLIDAAVQAGTIRPDTEPDDLLKGLSGFCMVSDAEGWQERASRLVTLLMDGLRYGASGANAAAGNRG